MAAFYNEHDKGAAQWLRELIADGLIADGVVDERDIRDIAPADLDGFAQCHFFAGIGGWPLALRMANWPDDRPVWTGSCPCQPFSVAGKGGGVDDERHLWPAFRWLIAQRRPPGVFGEQVASGDGREWIAGVSADLEAMGYVCGVADMCAAGFGAPHIRQRLWWVAYGDGSGGVRNGRQSDEPEKQSIDQHPAEGVDLASSAGLHGPHDDGGASGGIHSDSGERRGASGLAYGDESGPQGRHGAELRERAGQCFVGASVPVDWTRTVWWPCRDGKSRRVPARWVARSGGPREEGGVDKSEGGRRQQRPDGRRGEGAGTGEAGTRGAVGYGRIHRGVENLHGGGCGARTGEPAGEPEHSGGTDGGLPDTDRGRQQERDAAVRRISEHEPDVGAIHDTSRHGRLEVEPALFPLADGIPGRVGLLRGAGNAIVPQVAKAFIEASEGAREEIGGIE